MLKILFIIIIAYLIGSIPFGFIVGKLVKNVDVRERGSKSTGATNVFRTIGIVPAIIVLILDIGKGFIAVSLVSLFIPGGHHIELIKIIAGLCAVAGHNWPIFLQFKGGKGVATSFGVLLSLAPVPTIVSSIVFGIVVFATRYVSLGSIIAFSIFPLNCLILGRKSTGFILFTIIIAFIIIVRHRSNIRRLISGTENKIGKPKID